MMNPVFTLIFIVNLSGAMAVYIYFEFILPGGIMFSGVPAYYSPVCFVGCLVVLAMLALLMKRGHVGLMLDVGYGKTQITELDEQDIHHLQRHALQFPWSIAFTALFLWTLAGFFFGFVQPLMAVKIYHVKAPELILCVRRFVRISLLGGGVTSLVLFFVLENAWRRYIPAFFPDGNLSRVKHVFRLNLRKRFLIVFLSIILIPLPVIGISVFTAMGHIAPGELSSPGHVISSLAWELAFIALDSLAIVLILAWLLSKSILTPLLNIKRVVREVENGNLDTQVQIVSNDELGEVSEGVNLMIDSLKETRKVKDSFGRYVCREIRDEILAGNISTEGEMKRVTLLFADLRNFTGLVEKNHPRHVVKIMNRYFTEMTRVIKAHKGLVLQYVGDEIEAAFGAPKGYDEHPEMAVRAALAMRNSLKQLNRELEAAGAEPLAHGIGIHSGAVLAGNIGSEVKMSYSLVGDTVNTASRIQELTREYDCDIVLTQTTHNLLTGSYRTCQLEPVKVKGKNEGLIIYKLL
jgi:class 3 adenylate cyclase